MRPGTAFVIGAIALAGTACGQAPAAKPPAQAKPAAPQAAKPAQPQAAKPGVPQGAKPAQAQEAKPGTAKDSKSTPPAPEAYTYEPDGRRDPFLSLVGAGIDGRTVAQKGEGAAGLTVAEVSVRGVMQSRGALIAMIHGADNKTYIVHQGDKLADGTIKTITPQGLIIVQEVSDPLSLVKQREVRKLLRSLEDAKE